MAAVNRLDHVINAPGHALVCVTALFRQSADSFSRFVREIRDSISELSPFEGTCWFGIFAGLAFIAVMMYKIGKIRSKQ